MINTTLPCGLKYYNICAPATGIKWSCDNSLCRLKVEGTGNIRVRPDKATVGLGVITEELQLEAAQRENTEAVTNILATLGGLGIPSENIQTQTYSIAPQYDYVDGRQVFRGYRVEHILEVTIADMRSIGVVIDAAVQSGANQVGNVIFSAANPSVYYRQALTQAVDDALAKVRTLGDRLDIAVSQTPLQIIEKGVGQEPIVPLTYQTAIPATPVQTGMIEISARIEAVFSCSARA